MKRFMIMLLVTVSSIGGGIIVLLQFYSVDEINANLDAFKQEVTDFISVIRGENNDDVIPDEVVVEEPDVVLNDDYVVQPSDSMFGLITSGSNSIRLQLIAPEYHYFNNNQRIYIYDENNVLLVEHIKIVNDSIDDYYFDDLDYDEEYTFKFIADYQDLSNNDIFYDKIISEDIFSTLGYETGTPTVTVDSVEISASVLTIDFSTNNFDEVDVTDILVVLYEDRVEKSSETVSENDLSSVSFSSLSYNSQYEIVVTANIDGVSLDITNFILGKFYFDSPDSIIQINHYSLLLSDIEYDDFTFSYGNFSSVSSPDLNYSLYKDNVFVSNTLLDFNDAGVFEIQDLDLDSEYLIVVLSDTDELVEYKIYPRYSTYDNEQLFLDIYPGGNMSSVEDLQDLAYTELLDGNYYPEGTCDESSTVDCADISSSLDNELLDILDFVHPYYSSFGYSYNYNVSNFYINYSYFIDVTYEVDPVTGDSVVESKELTSFVRYTQDDIDDIEVVTNNVINKLIGTNINLATFNTDSYIREIHDYVVENVSYDDVCYNDSTKCENAHSAVGVLMEQSAVCEGYAQTMDIMLRKIGYNTYRIASDTHEWNTVKVNGTWLHLDATWDDPIGGSPNDDYFLITTSELHTLDSGSDHTFDTVIHSYIN